MLRITISNSTTEERWTVEGRLVAPWANELMASWKKSHGATPEKKCTVNLDEVTFIDKCGERVLRHMSKQGAQFVARDVFVKHVLDRLRRKSEL
jgi:anti-anti-sigma regulatory factor